jgi:hypothetical protein
MLTQDEIRQALHASRSVPLGVANPHGPLGLEHLAAAVEQLRAGRTPCQDEPHMKRTVELSEATWARLDQLAKKTAKTTAQSVTASQVAEAILAQYVAAEMPYH